MLTKEQLEELLELLTGLSSRFYDNPNGPSGRECPICRSYSCNDCREPDHKRDCEIMKAVVMIEKSLNT